MCSQGFGDRLILVVVTILITFSFCFHGYSASPMQCDVSSSESCPASLYSVSSTMTSLKEVASLYKVKADSVKRAIDGGFSISINCSCLADHNVFVSHIDYVVQGGDTWESISSKFGSFVLQNPENVLVPSRIVTLDLLCGCSPGAVLVTYNIKKGDTLSAICSRFRTNLNKTATLNKLENPDRIYAGETIFLPQPGLQNLSLIGVNGEDGKIRKASKFPIAVVVGVVSAAFLIVVVAVLLIFWKRHKKKGARHYLDASSSHSKSEETIVSSLSSDKAFMLPYHEICDATSNFSMSLKIGEGAYGSVYLGSLRGTDVAIKQMKNTKSKEFLSELNILCKVHHNNLIELIGYAAGGDSLFLVYEFAKNGALSDHLHRGTFKGYEPLSWTMRVQIALDAARGLEYIHERTRPYYVHRDVKTSNILLDSDFRAKIADFGLVKLLEHSPDVGDAASRIVGTFGYLAPEYVRDGCVTTKNDVYSFGVVLMELLTSQPALSKDSSHEKEQNSEHRSLVHSMLSALNNTRDSFTELTKLIDPSLSCYHEDSLFQMALLSKECVDDNWNKRPDMSKVVLRLSHILSSSEACEQQKGPNEGSPAIVLQARKLSMMAHAYVTGSI